MDYFGARYYSSAQGRFTSADPLLSAGRIEDPRTWNRYSYALNSPLRYIDPLGLYDFDKSVGEEQRQRFRSEFEQAKKDLEKTKENYGEKSDEYKKAKRALDSYGAEGDKNGVIVAVNDNQALEGKTNRPGQF